MFDDYKTMSVIHIFISHTNPDVEQDGDIVVICDYMQVVAQGGLQKLP